MTDEERAYYEEWKKKCAETRERKQRESAEVQAKTMEERPGYRLITRGPNKGQFKWIGYKQQRIDRSTAALAKRRKEEEARKLLEPATAVTLLKPEEPKKKLHGSAEFIWAIIFYILGLHCFVSNRQDVCLFWHHGLGCFY